MPLFEDTRFLVVDDEAIFREENVKKLAELGFREAFIDTATNGSEAFALATQKESAYEFFIIDLVMPEVNGLELIEKLSKLERYRSTPKLVVSGSFDRAIVKQVAQVGASGFVVKPVELQTLAKKIISCNEGR